MKQRQNLLYKDDEGTERRAFSLLMPYLLQGDVELDRAYRILSGCRLTETGLAKLTHLQIKHFLYAWHKGKRITIIRGKVRLNYNQQLLLWLDSKQAEQMLRFMNNPVNLRSRALHQQVEAQT